MQKVCSKTSMIEKILIPKSLSDIEKSICNLYGVKEDDVKAICKLNEILRINNIDTSTYNVPYLVFIEDDLGEETGLQMKAIKTELRVKRVDIDEKIKNWGEIYDDIVLLMTENCEIFKHKFEDEKKLISVISSYINLIAVNTRIGPGKFVIMNSKVREKITTNFPYYIHVIIDDKFENKILVGRKQNDIYATLQILKYKDQYKFAITDISYLKNYYICIDCEFD